MKKYGKVLTMAVAAALTWVAAKFTDNEVVTDVEWANVGLTAIAAVQVFFARNVVEPGSEYVKSIMAGLGALAVLLTSLVTSGVSATETWQVAIAGLGAVGVVFAPGPKLVPPGTVPPQQQVA